MIVQKAWVALAANKKSNAEMMKVDGFALLMQPSSAHGTDLCAVRRNGGPLKWFILRNRRSYLPELMVVAFGFCTKSKSIALVKGR